MIRVQGFEVGDLAIGPKRCVELEILFIVRGGCETDDDACIVYGESDAENRPRAYQDQRVSRGPRKKDAGADRRAIELPTT